MSASGKRRGSSKQGMSSVEAERAPRSLSVSRRGVLVVAGTGLASHLVGCGSDKAAQGGAGAGGIGGVGGSTPGPGGSAGTAGVGGSSGTGAGGAGGSGVAGSGGPSPGSGGGSNGTAGTGGSAADGSADFAADAKIEVGSPPGMIDGASATCTITQRDQLGPYHLAGHPDRQMMATANDGQILVVTGRVLNTKCQPLGGAELDVWSANARGVYSETPNGWCRGKVRTDASGHYRFETVYPGVYQGRPRHLHLMIAQAGYDRVTTQMYFKGERPDIAANAVDKVMANGGWQSQWDIVLRGGPTASRLAPLPTRQSGSRIVQPDTLPRRFWGRYWRPSKA